jgi:cytoskeletal protein RodZ
MLPERVYSLGFVRSYALFLGLDYQEAVTQFKNEIYGNHRAEPLSVPGPILETSRANWKVILICTAIVGVVILAWYKLTQKNNDPEPTHTAMQIQDLTKEEQTSVEDSQSTLSELHSPLEVTQKSVIVQSLKPKTQTSNIPLSSISGEQTPKR